MIALVDPETYRAESRERWERAAAGWAATREAMEGDAAPVTEWLLDAAALRPGMTVLELAAGAGETGLAAARRVAPDGRAIVTDGAEGMVEVARARARELGVENAELRAMEAEWIDLPAAAVDAVLCRWGLMLLVDPEAALREVRRVLRPGGRVALAVWDEPRANPWITTAQRVLVERGVVPRAAGDEPGPFALADAGRLEELLWGAGLSGVRVEPLDFAFTAASADEWWDHLRQTSTRVSQALAGLAPAEHYAVRDAFDAAYAPFAGPDGAIRVPARALMATAEA